MVYFLNKMLFSEDCWSSYEHNPTCFNLIQFAYLKQNTKDKGRLYTL